MELTSGGHLISVKETKTFKILSIDGGGIKGLYSSTILEKFEERFECVISDHFDMLCGTSTGGLIALALSQKIPASEISKLYMDKGNYIFPQHNIRNKIQQAIGRGKYDNSNLKECLLGLFGTKTLKDSKNLLCIPAYDYTNEDTCVFKVDHKEGNYGRDNNIRYVDIALATSAAPTYFPICEIADLNKQYIDGGVWGNNPSLAGVIEALCHFVGKNKAYDKIQILSIGSLDTIKGNPLEKKKHKSALKWGLDLLSPFMNGQCQFAHHTLELLQKHSDIDYVRIPSTNISRKQEKDVGMDKATKNALKFMQGQGQTQACKYWRETSVCAFFETKKTYIF